MNPYCAIKPFNIEIELSIMVLTAKKLINVEGELVCVCIANPIIH